MKTLLLTTDQWDLCLDAARNIAVATDSYSVVQDVASSCRVFLGEEWYDTTQGVPYFQQILGQLPPAAFIKAQIAAAAAKVPGCFNPVVYLGTFTNRVLTGQVQFQDINGVQQVAAF